MTRVKITHKYINDYSQIVKSLIPDMKAIIEDEVIDKVEKELKRLHELPLRFWKGGERGLESKSSKRVRFPKPTIEIKKKLKIEYRQQHIEVRIQFDVTLKNGGKIHKLYYWLDRGTPSFTMQSDSAWFPPRPVNRTIPNSLDVRAEPGYLEFGGENRHLGKYTKVQDGIVYKRIPAGGTREGIEARNWSKVISERTNNYIQSIAGNWTLTYDLNNPF